MMTRQVKYELLLHTPVALCRAIARAFIGTAMVVWVLQMNAFLVSYVVPSGYWISDISLQIPDHETGDNPWITLERTIHSDFVADLVIEYRSLDEATKEVCTYRKQPIYQANGEGQWRGRLLSQTGGCTIPPGCWVSVNRLMYPTFWDATKVLEFQSAPFSVRAKGEDKSIDRCSDVT